jgi:hypothetical protein
LLDQDLDDYASNMTHVDYTDDIYYEDNDYALARNSTASQARPFVPRGQLHP